MVAMSNSSPWSLQPRRRGSRIRCPDEETGRNSVTAWTSARTAASNGVMRRILTFAKGVLNERLERASAPSLREAEPPVQRAQASGRGGVRAFGLGPRPEGRARALPFLIKRRRYTSADEGHHPRRRLRHAALPDHARRVSKQLLPVYDKPMIYYPLSTLMLAGIRDILVITTPAGPGRASSACSATARDFGIRLSYAAQPQPEGLAQAFIIGRDFVGDDRVALVLGDNIFYGHGFPEALRGRGGAASGRHRLRLPGARSRALRRRRVRRRRPRRSPSRRSRRKPRSHWAVTGLYFYDNRVLDIAAGLKPSARGELEITDVNRAYLGAGELHVERPRPRHRLARHRHARVAAPGVAASSRRIEERQGLKVACLEEIAFRMGYHHGAEARAPRRPSWARPSTATTCAASCASAREATPAS